MTAILVVGTAVSDARAAAIHQAVTSGNLATVKSLMSKNSSLLNLKDRNGYTPLHYAVSSNRTAIVTYLLEKNADVNAQTRYNYSVLHFAVMNRSAAILDALLAKKPKLELKDNAGQTPLFICLQHGNRKAFDKLIDSGANVKAVTRSKQTLLHLACNYSRADFANVLLKKGLAIDPKDTAGQTPLYFAAQRGQTELVKILIKKGAKADTRINNKYQPSPLFAACQAGHVETVKLLLKHKVDVSIANPNGDRPLHVAANLGGQFYGYYNPQQLESRRKQYGTIVAALLKSGAAANVTNKQKKTPLQLAVAQDNYEAVDQLVPRTEDVDITPTTGETLLHWSAMRLDADHRLLSFSKFRPVGHSLEQHVLLFLPLASAKDGLYDWRFLWR